MKHCLVLIVQWVIFMVQFFSASYNHFLVNPVCVVNHEKTTEAKKLLLCPRSYYLSVTDTHIMFAL